MKIFIICSKHHSHKVPEIKEDLENKGHIVTLPNSFEDPMLELRILEADKKAHSEWVAKAWDESEEKIKDNDAVLVINLEKNNQQNYISGATFTEIFMAYRMKKRIFMFNDIPESNFKDELTGMNPIILNGDLTIIK